MTKKGICTHNRIVYGMVTISEKGQLAIPVDLRRDLNINTGDRLLVIKRKDNAGFTLLKQNVMDTIISKIQDDEGYLNKMNKGEKK
jgi:AbrB family looped-hinge helix DNA binding protein